MTDSMEMKPEGWPEEILADLGEEGRIRCKIALHGDETPIHFMNHTEIMKRWADLWPAARKIIRTMRFEYERDPEVNTPGSFLIISIPDEPIREGVEWSIALENDDFDGVWDASFVGWSACPDESQPYF